MKHLTDQQVNDLADGRVSAEERGVVDVHLASCPECRERSERLQSLLAEARGLPSDLDPEEDLWPAIRDAIDRNKVVPLGQAAERPLISLWPRGGVIAAAAVGLVVLSSAITALVLRRAPGPANPTATVSTSSPELPVSVARLVSNYEIAAARLGEAFDRRRPQLPPETIARIEHNLRIIDDAIAETTDMLRIDHDNDVLIQLLEATYRQKVAVLELAAESSL